MFIGAKLGVSDWTLFFNDNDKIIHIDTVYSETIKYFADGSISIIITDALINSDLINEIKNKNNIYKVEQMYQLRDISNGNDIKEIQTFINLKIISVNIKSAENKVTTVDIILTNII